MAQKIRHQNIRPKRLIKAKAFYEHQGYIVERVIYSDFWDLVCFKGGLAEVFVQIFTTEKRRKRMEEVDLPLQACSWAHRELVIYSLPLQPGDVPSNRIIFPSAPRR